MSTEGLHLPNDVELPSDVEQLRTIIATQSVTLAQRERILAQRDVVITEHAIVIAQREAVIKEHESLIAEREVVIAQHEVVIAQGEAVIASQHDTIEKQLKKLAGLEQQLARVLRRQYGPQQERIDPNQLTLFTPEEIAELVKELEQSTLDSVSTDDGSPEDESRSEQSSADESSTKPKRKGHGRRPIPPHIPRETVVYELGDEERLCPCCGRPRQEIGREVSEQLEFIPAQLKVLRHERVRYACQACEEHVALAPKPPQPIAKGLPGPGLLAYLTLSKYGDYLPLYRLEDMLSRSGILLRRSTLCGWIATVADLLEPLYDALCQRVRRSRVIHTDDTGIKMLAEGQCRNCQFWTYVGDEANPFVVYEFSLTRAGREPTRFLEDFVGYLQADAFSGYDQVYSRGRVIEVACLAHCRRYWWEARETDSRRAHEALGYIARLYELETRFEHAQLKGDALRDARGQHAIPILAAFETWLREEQPQVLPKSLIGQAFTYTLNQWQALCRYTEDGVLQIDNNLAERMVKLPSIGRKNWLFVGSESGGHRAAILLSIIASAKHCQVEPWAWLSAVLKELPLRLGPDPRSRPPDISAMADISDLMPDAWLKVHPEHRWKIDDIRKEERKRSRQQKTHKRNSQGR